MMGWGKEDAALAPASGGTPPNQRRRWKTLERRCCKLRTAKLGYQEARAFLRPSSPQRAILAGPSATPTAGSVQNQPICRAPFLVPFVLTLQGSHFQAHTSCTTSTSLV